MKDFYRFPEKVYRKNSCYHSTGEETARLLGSPGTPFRSHAEIKPVLIESNGEIKGRFFFIRDQRLPEYLQVACFEALPGLEKLDEIIAGEGQKYFPSARKIVVGLNGHLNYGAGLLLNHYDEPPVYEMPYNPPYYPTYFKNYAPREIVSFRFNTAPFHKYFDNFEDSVWNGISTRYMNKRKFKKEIKLYTQLNNDCFGPHPFWTPRDPEEDLEIFHPFRHFMEEDNLIFAELNGKPIGFALWFPDFNQLINQGTSLGLKQWLTFKKCGLITTFRFMEIGVLPGYQISKASFALIYKMAVAVKKRGYIDGEGGFIFKENSNSIRLVSRYLHRAFGEESGPYRRYAVFEKEL